MIEYRIKSIDTKLLIAQTGFEKPGQLVVSDTGRPHAPPFHHHLTFSKPVSPGHVVKTTIRQWNGLYIGLDKGIGRLIWTTEAFEWQVAPTGPYYQFFPMNDDLYWYQTKPLVPFVGVAPGHDLVPPQLFFEVQSVN